MLVQINEKMRLGLPIDCVNLEALNIKLNKKKNILKELNRLSCNKRSWYWLLNELRNHSIHRAMLNKGVSVGIIENVNDNTTKSMKPHVAFLVNPLDKVRKLMDETVIEYLDKSLQRMRQLIDRIKNKSFQR